MTDKIDPSGWVPSVPAPERTWLRWSSRYGVYHHWADPRATRETASHPEFDAIEYVRADLVAGPEPVGDVSAEDEDFGRVRAVLRDWGRHVVNDVFLVGQLSKAMAEARAAERGRLRLQTASRIRIHPDPPSEDWICTVAAVRMKLVAASFGGSGMARVYVDGRPITPGDTVEACSAVEVRFDDGDQRRFAEFERVDEEQEKKQAAPRPLRVGRDDARHDPANGPVLVRIEYFKPTTGKWYCTDEVEWKPDPTHYTRWQDFRELHRLKDMTAVCVATPLGFPVSSPGDLSSWSSPSQAPAKTSRVEQLGVTKFHVGDVVAFLPKMRFRIDEVTIDQRAGSITYGEQIAEMTMIANDQGTTVEFKQLGGPCRLRGAVVVPPSGGASR